MELIMENLDTPVADMADMVSASLPQAPAPAATETTTVAKSHKRTKSEIDTMTDKELRKAFATLMKEHQALGERFSALSERMAKLEVKDPIALGRQKLEELLDDILASGAENQRSRRHQIVGMAGTRWTNAIYEVFNGSDDRAQAARNIIQTAAREAVDAHLVTRARRETIPVGNVEGLQRYVRTEIASAHALARDAVVRSTRDL